MNNRKKKQTNEQSREEQQQTAVAREDSKNQNEKKDGLDEKKLNNMDGTKQIDVSSYCSMTTTSSFTKHNKLKPYC